MGSILCQSCYQDIPGASERCPRCGAVVVRAVAAAGSPWEQRKRRGLIAALGETLQNALFEPTTFFRSLRPDGGARAALHYAVVINVIATFISWLWKKALPTPFAVPGAGLSAGGFAAFLLLLLPVIVVLAIVSWSSVLHLSLVLTGGARRRFSTTLQAVAYANSASAFSVFPVVGAPLGLVWGAVLQIIGLREGHGLSTARALFAWILPFLLFLSTLFVILYFALDFILLNFPEVESFILA